MNEYIYLSNLIHNFCFFISYHHDNSYHGDWIFFSPSIPTEDNNHLHLNQHFDWDKLVFFYLSSSLLFFPLIVFRNWLEIVYNKSSFNSIERERKKKENGSSVSKPRQIYPEGLSLFNCKHLRLYYKLFRFTMKFSCSRGNFHIVYYIQLNFGWKFLLHWANQSINYGQYISRN